jgi:hypothetical protein
VFRGLGIRATGAEAQGILRPNYRYFGKRLISNGLRRISLAANGFRRPDRFILFPSTSALLSGFDLFVPPDLSPGLAADPLRIRERASLHLWGLNTVSSAAGPYENRPCRLDPQ